MELTRQQNRSLDALKNQLLDLESKMSNMKEMMDLSTELNDLDKWKECDSIYETLNKKHVELVSHQSQSWGLDSYLMLDLIFDREHTLNLIKELNLDINIKTLN